MARVDEHRTLTVPEPPVALEEVSTCRFRSFAYVLNSDETVNLGDVRKDLTFANDAYLLSRQPLFPTLCSRCHSAIQQRVHSTSKIASPGMPSHQYD